MAMTPEEIAAFQNQRAGIRNRYGRTLSRNAYARGSNEQTFQRQMQQFNTAWDRSREKVPSQFAARGMLESGLYQRGLQDYAVSRQQNLADQIAAFQQRQADIEFADADAGFDMNDALSSIDMQEAARRAALAAQLRAMG